MRWTPGRIAAGVERAGFVSEPLLPLARARSNRCRALELQGGGDRVQDLVRDTLRVVFLQPDVPLG